MTFAMCLNVSQLNLSSVDQLGKQSKRIQVNLRNTLSTDPHACFLVFTFSRKFSMARDGLVSGLG